MTVFTISEPGGIYWGIEQPVAKKWTKINKHRDLLGQFKQLIDDRFTLGPKCQEVGGLTLLDGSTSWKQIKFRLRLPGGGKSDGLRIRMMANCETKQIYILDVSKKPKDESSLNRLFTAEPSVIWPNRDD